MTMSAQSLHSQIKEDYLTCPICCNNFIKPKALPCIHTFCESCLRDYVHSRGYESVGVFPCPICRQECVLPSHGIAGFPDNHLMSSLSDTVEKSNQFRPVPKPRKSLGNPGDQRTDMDDKNGTDVDNPPLSTNNMRQTENYNQNQPHRHRPVFPMETHHSEIRPKSDFDITTGPDDFAIVESRNWNDGTSVDASPPPPYSSVADSKVCSNDPDWAIVPKPNPTYENIDRPQMQPNIGWDLQNLPSVSNNQPHFISGGATATYPQRVFYPSVPTNFDENVSCTESMVLRFGKLGSTPRDFIKPVSLVVNKEGQYIILDCGGDQNRIMIFNSEGEITTAFKCGAKVNDISVTLRNEVIASVHKGTSAFRLFTMGGQLKGEYGKFFTYEQPNGIAELGNGGVVLTGAEGHCVYVLNQQMKLSSKFGRKGNGDGYFIHPAFVAVNSKDHIVVTDKVNNCVQVFYSDGKFKRRFGSNGKCQGQLTAPLGVCVDSQNNIIVADSGNFRVEVFTPYGEWLSTVVKDTQQLGENVKPVSVAMTPTGKVAVLLCGPYFAEVRVYASRHQQIVLNNPGPITVTSCLKL